MSDRIRVQLQQGNTDIDSVAPGPGAISADEAIKALSRLSKNNKDYKPDAEWQKELASAIKDATAWVKRVKSGGGLVPRGSGNVISIKFKFDRKEYRIDIEVQGKKDADWFK